MRTLIVLMLIFFLKAAYGQKEIRAEIHGIKAPSEFMGKDRAKVLVVGTFHFDYPGLDEHKTTDENRIDVLEEPKKTEVSELVAYLKLFRPTKIVIEARPNWGATNKLRAYKEGEYRNERDERFQLGMRMAKDLQLDTLYSVDSKSLMLDIYENDSTLYRSLTDKIDWDAPDPYYDMAENWLEYDDRIIKEVNLVDYFKYMNSREVHNANFGLYLTGSISTGEGQGANYLSMNWYNRNVRIFSNIINLTEGDSDRIMVIIGNGHAAILRQLFDASPQYQYMEFDGLGE